MAQVHQCTYFISHNHKMVLKSYRGNICPMKNWTMTVCYIHACTRFLLDWRWEYVLVLHQLSSIAATGSGQHVDPSIFSNELDLKIQLCISILEYSILVTKSTLARKQICKAFLDSGEVKMFENQMCHTLACRNFKPQCRSAEPP